MLAGGDGLPCLLSHAQSFDRSPRYLACCNRIMMNLVTNAIKYSLSGAGVLGVAARQRGDRCPAASVGYRLRHYGSRHRPRYLTSSIRSAIRSAIARPAWGWASPFGRLPWPCWADKINCRSEVGRGSVFEFMLRSTRTTKWSNISPNRRTTAK